MLNSPILLLMSDRNFGELSFALWLSHDLPIRGCYVISKKNVILGKSIFSVAEFFLSSLILRALIQNCIRYAVRQKRADTKKALKNLLFNGGCSMTKPEKSFSKIEADYMDQLNKKSRIKPARQARRAYHKKMKQKHRRENSCEDFDEYPERIFETINGKRFEWTFKPWEMGFDWRETSDWSKSTYQEHDAKSRIESDDESFTVGSYADRRILGLPTAGPLKIEDVKSAFRQSALKWHPDKHQGPSQANAEEKFKNCANAYKSLCNALATA